MGQRSSGEMLRNSGCVPGPRNGTGEHPSRGRRKKERTAEDVQSPRAHSGRGGPASRNGWRRKGFPPRRRTGEEKDRAVQDHRRVGLQRKLPRSDDSGAAGRSRTCRPREPPAGVDFPALHGLEIPIEQDGVPYISQKPVAPGEKYVYEFTVHQEGTFFYHAHSAMQEMMGQIGFFVAHPERDYKPRVDDDYGLILQEWAVLPSNTVPNTAAMEFNWLTFNGVSAPMTTPLLARLGSRVRLRILNLGMDHHPVHLHGHQFVVTGTEGGRAPESTWCPMNTVLVSVAQARVVEFEANYPGAWMIHCHLPHHMMNSMMDLLRDRQIQTADQTEAKAMSQMESLARSVPFQHVHPSPVAPNAESVPGFPQDAFMEMGMDEVVEKPETYGLPKNWSAGMMGMMTMVRVLPDKEYDAIMMKKKTAGPSAQEEHHHES